MSRWTPCKRSEFIRRLRKVGFDGPYSGTHHQFMIYQQHRLTVPGTLHIALYIAFTNWKRYGPGALEKATLTRALSSIIQRHAPLQHGGDVAWALWGAIVFDIVFGNEVVDALERLNDPVAVLMALLAEQDGKLSRGLSRTQWEAQMTASELFDSRWILVYEGVGHGWLRPTAGDPALSDRFFADARGKAISFFDPTALRVIPPPSPAGEYGRFRWPPLTAPK